MTTTPTITPAVQLDPPVHVIIDPRLDDGVRLTLERGGYRAVFAELIEPLLKAGYRAFCWRFPNFPTFKQDGITRADARDYQGEIAFHSDELRCLCRLSNAQHDIYTRPMKDWYETYERWMIDYGGDIWIDEGGGLSVNDWQKAKVRNQFRAGCEPWPDAFDHYARTHPFIVTEDLYAAEVKGTWPKNWAIPEDCTALNSSYLWGGSRFDGTKDKADLLQRIHGLSEKAHRLGLGGIGIAGTLLKDYSVMRGEIPHTMIGGGK